ncbi:hypothetical protein [[Mycobacterium] nativiensis]|uniref:Bacterial virulence protein VirB8 domain-containing protein n=1 Tax=[Mycobacterium] nativiensis TaxID=2855503 RepID=A0ABU5XQK5_9MYCO|nr:hypothetical protein [Mycolicibacter sp. MYC340]MEB3030127.1 hypothetical protein [Mycolicibacter sp. MYC340]
MSSRDPAKPDATKKDALTLAEAEAQAAEAEAEAARARAKLLKLQRDSAQTEVAAAGPESDAEDAAEDSQVAEDPEAVGADTAEPAVAPRGLGRIRKQLPWVAATLAVLAIGGLVVSDALMVVHHRGVAQRQHQAAEYAAAARQGVVTLMSLNYETVDDDVKRIIDNSTGEFKKDFETHAEDFIKTAQAAKTITEATATVSGVESMSANEAVVLVAASTKVTNKAGAKDEPRSWRLAVHLTREDDQVKMSKVDFAT